jgi:hypothetical protein
MKLMFPPVMMNEALNCLMCYKQMLHTGSEIKITRNRPASEDGIWFRFICTFKMIPLITLVRVTFALKNI